MVDIGQWSRPARASTRGASGAPGEPGAAASVTLPARAAAAVRLLAAGVDALLGLDLVELTSLELLEVLRSVEVQTRRSAVVDHRLVAEIDDRKVAAELCQPSTAVLLRQLLHLSPREATRRVQAAVDLGPRRTLTGQLLPPLFEPVAVALATGVISPEHARVITATIDKLPHAVEAEYGATVQACLLEQAADLDPMRLANLARQLLDYLDPDGSHSDDADHERHREVNVVGNRDGSFTLSGRLTPECGALAETVLDSLSRPVPATDATPDPRRAGQRRHDALQDLLTRALRVGQLPDCGGVSATLILTAGIADAEAGTGFATTAHGGLIAIKRAIDLVGDGQIITVLFDPHGGVLDYGRLQRLAPLAMRLALIARDKGCTFPGCDRPPTWTQAHHIRAWADGGPTSLENLTLLCGYHHRNFARQGWQASIINGQPHWTAPTWKDPSRTPTRNTIHDTDIRSSPPSPLSPRQPTPP
jgi:Domain of unknown function (DUF222)/HNH endonuclease